MKILHIDTVYRRIYCRNFLTLSNQTPLYIRKCIRTCNKTSDTEILYSKYRIALHKMSELDEISDSGIEILCIRMGRRGLQSSRSGLKDTDLLHSTSVQSCALTLCTSHQGFRGHSGAKVQGFNLRRVPAVP